MQKAFGDLGAQVDGVERRLGERIDNTERFLGGRIDDVDARFVKLREEVSGSLPPRATDGSPPAPPVLLNGPSPPATPPRPPSLTARVSTTASEAAALRADVNRLLALQEQQMGIGVSFLQWLTSRSGRKMLLSVLTLACAAYAAISAKTPPPAAAPLPPAAHSP